MCSDGARIFVFGTSSNSLLHTQRSTSVVMVQTKAEIRPAPLWMNILRQGKIETALLTFPSQWAHSSFPSPKRSSTNYALCATNFLHLHLHSHLVDNSFHFSFAGDIGCFTLVSGSRRNGPLIWLLLEASDDHGCDNPCGFAGTGVTGAGHNILTCDVPVPVWAGDGSVT